MGKLDQIKEKFREKFDALSPERKAEIIKQFSVMRRQTIMEVEKHTDYLDTLIRRKYGYLLLQGRTGLYRTILNYMLEQAKLDKPEHLRLGQTFDFTELDNEIAYSLLGIEADPSAEPEKPPIVKIDQYHYEIWNNEIDILGQIIEKEGLDTQYMKVTYPDNSVVFFIRSGDYFYTFNPDRRAFRTEFAPVKGMRVEFLADITESKPVESLLPLSHYEALFKFAKFPPPERDEPLAVEELNGNMVILRINALANLKKAVNELKVRGADIVLNVKESIRSAADQTKLKSGAILLADLPNLSTHQTGGAIDISIAEIDTRKQEISKFSSKIRTIKQNAKDKHRELTAVEQAAIDKFQSDIDVLNVEINTITATKMPRVVKILNAHGFYNVFASEPWHFEFIPDGKTGQERAYDTYNIVTEFTEPVFKEEVFQKRYELLKKLVKGYCGSEPEAQYIAINIERVLEEVEDFPDTPEALAFIVATFHRESQLRQFPEVNPAQIKKLNNYLSYLEDKSKFVGFCNQKLGEKHSIIAMFVPDSKFEELFDILHPIYKSWRSKLPNGAPQTEFEVGYLLIQLKEALKRFAMDNTYEWVADLFGIIDKIEAEAQRLSPDSLGIGQINYKKAAALFEDHKRKHPGTTIGPASMDFETLNAYIYTLRGGIAASVLYTKNVFYSHDLCNTRRAPPCSDNYQKVLYNMRWVTADYNAGEFSCRNSFFQKEVNDLARWLRIDGYMPIDIDGDLGVNTIEAVRILFEKCDIDIDEDQIEKDLGKVDDPTDKKRAVENSETYKKVLALYRNFSVGTSLKFVMGKLGLDKKYSMDPLNTDGKMGGDIFVAIDLLMKEGKIRPISNVKIMAALANENFCKTDLYKELRDLYRRVFIQDSVNELIGLLKIPELNLITVNGVFDQSTVKGIFDLLKKKGLRISEEEIKKDLESTDDLASTVTYKELIDYRNRVSFQKLVFSFYPSNAYVMDGDIAGDKTVNILARIFIAAGQKPNESLDQFHNIINGKAMKSDLSNKFFQNTVTYDRALFAIHKMHPRLLQIQLTEDLLPIELNDDIPQTLSHSRSKDLNIYVRNYVGGTFLRVMSKLSYKVFSEVREKYAYRNNKKVEDLITSDYYDMWPEFVKKYEECGASCRLASGIYDTDQDQAATTLAESVTSRDADKLTVVVPEEEKKDFVKVSDTQYTIGGEHIEETGKGFFAITKAKYVSVRRNDREPYLATWNQQNQDYFFRDGTKLVFWNKNNYTIEIVEKTAGFKRTGENSYKIEGERVPQNALDFYNLTRAIRIGVKINGRDEKIANWNPRKNTYVFADGKRDKLIFFNKTSYELRVIAIDPSAKSEEEEVSIGLVNIYPGAYTLVGVKAKRGRNMVEVIRETAKDFYEVSHATYILVEEKNVAAYVNDAEGNRYISSRYAKWDEFTQAYRYLDAYNENVVFRNDHRYTMKVLPDDFERQFRLGEDTKPNKFHVRTTAGGYMYLELYGEGISQTGKDLHDGSKFRNFRNQISINGLDAVWDEASQNYLYVDSNVPVEFVGGYKYVIESRGYLQGVGTKITADLPRIERRILKSYAAMLTVGENFIFVNKRYDKQYVILAKYVGDGKFEILVQDTVSTARMIDATKEGIHTIQRISTARAWGKWYGAERDEYDYKVYDISGQSGMAIHPTDHPELFGRRASAGCVRIPFAFSRQIEGKVKFGTPVIIASI